MYLNSISNVPKGNSSIDLTLTRVVFECDYYFYSAVTVPNLTLTRVVFE